MALFGTIRTVEDPEVLHWWAERGEQIGQDTYRYHCGTSRGYPRRFTVDHTRSDGAELLAAKVLVEAKRLASENSNRQMSHRFAPHVLPRIVMDDPPWDAPILGGTQ